MNDFIGERQGRKKEEEQRHSKNKTYNDANRIQNKLVLMTTVIYFNNNLDVVLFFITLTLV